MITMSMAFALPIVGLIDGHLGVQACMVNPRRSSHIYCCSNYVPKTLLVGGGNFKLQLVELGWSFYNLVLNLSIITSFFFFCFFQHLTPQPPKQKRVEFSKSQNLLETKGVFGNQHPPFTFFIFTFFKNNQFQNILIFLLFI
jgi:hypothetical protein